MIKSRWNFLFLLITLAVAQEWGPCPAYGRNPAPVLSGATHECRNFSVPLNWAAPGLERINVMAHRYVFPDSHTELTAIPGGPGVSSTGIFPLLPLIAAMTQGKVDFFLIDHRGTGFSTNLECKGVTQREGYAKCAQPLNDQWGDKLHYFTPLQAAKDYLHIVPQIQHRSTKRQVAFAGSYGTYLLNKISYLNDTVFDRYIYDSVTTCNWYFSHFDSDTTRIFSKLVDDTCEEDPDCAVLFPQKTASSLLWEVFDGFDSNRCVQAANMTQDDLRYYVQFLSMSVELRTLILPVISHLSECSKQESVSAIVHWKQAMEAMFSANAEADDTLRSALGLQANIALSELYQVGGPAATFDEAQSRTDQGLASSYLSTTMAKAYPLWNRYTPDSETFQAITFSERPTLTFVGTLDANTGQWYAEQFAARLPLRTARLVLVPYAPHIATANSPMANDFPCGMKIAVDFILHPGTPDVHQLDTRCLKQVLKPDLAVLRNGTKESVRHFLGERIWSESVQQLQEAGKKEHPSHGQEDDDDDDVHSADRHGSSGPSTGALVGGCIGSAIGGLVVGYLLFAYRQKRSWDPRLSSPIISN